MTEKYGYKAVYLGGHAAFPKSMKCTLELYSDALEILQMPLRIQYKDIENVQSETQEKLSARRTALGALLLGPVGALVGLARKKKKLYMVLSYKDEVSSIQDMVFDLKKIGEAQLTIYRRMLQAKKLAMKD